MNYLVSLIKEIYPDRCFILTESHNTDEVYNVHIEYTIYIENTVSARFCSFEELQNFILEIYNTEKEGN